VSKQSKRDRQRENREARRQYLEALERRRRTWKLVRTLSFILVPVIAVGAFLSLKKDDEKPTTVKHEFATITTNFGDIIVELDGTEAPKSEAQFAKLAKSGFYDGLTIHRVSTSTGIIQGGDPNGDGTGGSGKTVPDELPTSAYKLGDLAYANSGPNTSDSQWFIVTGDPGTQLPPNYNRFGHVVRGLDIAQQIEALSPFTGDGTPTTPVTIVRITISKKAPPEAPNIPATTTTTAAP
jgi:cyclophilin family peptidyl-prolyl cis-trans isomerase